MIVRRIYAKAPECDIDSVLLKHLKYDCNMHLSTLNPPNAMLTTVYFLGQNSGSSRHLHLGVDTSSPLNFGSLLARRKNKQIFFFQFWRTAGLEKKNTSYSLNFGSLLVRRRKTHLLIWILRHCLPGEEKQLYLFEFCHTGTEKKNNSTCLNFVALAWRKIVWILSDWPPEEEGLLKMILCWAGKETDHNLFSQPDA